MGDPKLVTPFQSIYELIYKLNAFSRTSPSTYSLLPSVLRRHQIIHLGGGTKAEILLVQMSLFEGLSV